jgi:hypothetical protein
MDTLTYAEMEELSGQVGISVTWCQNGTATQTFTSLTPVPGDPDGWGVGLGDQGAGYLVFIGTGSNTGTIRISTPSKAMLTVDVGTTGAGTCQPAQTVATDPYAGIQIPPNTTFFQVHPVGILPVAV